MIGIIEFEMQEIKNHFPVQAIKVGYTARVKRESGVFYYLAVTEDIVTDDSILGVVHITKESALMLDFVILPTTAMSCTLNWVKVDGVQVFPN